MSSCCCCGNVCMCSIHMVCVPLYVGLETFLSLVPLPHIEIAYQISPYLMSINNTSPTRSLACTVCLLLNNMWMNIAERVTESCLVKCLKVLLGPRCRCCDSGHARHSTAQTYTSVMVSSHTLIFQKMQCSSLSVGGSLVTGNTSQGSTILLVFLVSFCYIHSCCLSHSVSYTHTHTCTHAHAIMITKDVQICVEEHGCVCLPVIGSSLFDFSVWIG